MNRRRFLQSLPLAGGLPEALAEDGASPAPIRTIYSNDTTHILSCMRPEERRKIEFSDELLARSIKEAAGVDAHFLQPGLGWIPWWGSKIYSAEDHYRWLQDEHGVKGVTKLGRYLLKGGDMLATLVSTCREIGLQPFLSFRLNDGHHTRDLGEALAAGRPTAKMARHYWDNYDRFRIGPDVKEWDQSVFDWTIPEVRDYKFALIEEACANYDLAGLELDFLRHWVRFREKTPLEERSAITTDFVGRVKKMLDKTGEKRGLPRRRLGIRVPANAAVRPEQGIDLKTLCDAGVDLVNLSYSYFTWQDDSVARAKEEIGEHAAIYAEMTHCTMTGRATAGSGTQPFLRTTDGQFYTTALLAYEQGATGVSLFNFPYYRYHVTDEIGPFQEPPFHVLAKLRDRKFLASQRPWYFLSAGRNDEVLGEKLLPLVLEKGERSALEFRLAKSMRPVGGGLLRLRSDQPVAGNVVEVTIGGVRLESRPFVAQPYANPHEGTWLGTEEDTLCFGVPEKAGRAGEKLRIFLRLKAGKRFRLSFADVTAAVQ